jgi:hypothetical protein
MQKENYMENEQQVLSLSQMRKVMGYRSQSSFIKALKSKMSAKEKREISIDQAKWSRIETYREIPLVSEAKVINKAIEELISEQSSVDLVSSIPLARNELGQLIVLKSGEVYQQ